MKKRFILKSSTRIETTFNKHLNFAYYHINRYKINSYVFRVLINRRFSYKLFLKNINLK